MVRDESGEEVELYDCPNRLLRGTDVWDVIHWYSMWSEGVQLFHGYGAAELPPKLTAAFNVIASEMAYWDEKKREREG